MALEDAEIRAEYASLIRGFLRLARQFEQDRETKPRARMLKHCIAFASSDIFAAAKALASNGVALLPVPENYYEDLEAKTDLSGDEIDRLRASNILYERDGDAEYFQLYTQTFANRFFFEIVERRNGYKGFGASNAQIRLAAQTRLSPIEP
jgi:3-dehydroshikimate dehydratase